MMGTMLAQALRTHAGVGGAPSRCEYFAAQVQERVTEDLPRRPTSHGGHLSQRHVPARRVQESVSASVIPNHYFPRRTEYIANEGQERLAGLDKA